MRFDNGMTMRLYRQTIEDFGLYSGLEMTGEDFKKLQEAAGKMSAKMRAVRIVAASSVSKKDLEQRLVQKGENRQYAQDAVAWMSDLNLLDDAQTAKQIVNRCAAKGYGIARAKQVLYEKRIPKQYWEEALEDYPDQQEHIRHFLQDHLTADADFRMIKKAIDALLRRGHSYSEVRRVLSQLTIDTEEFPEG